MATTLEWSQCPAVESIPGKRSGAWVFRGTRMPVSTVFENLQDMSVDELVEEFGVTREQVEAVLEFVAHSLEAPTLTAPDYSAKVDQNRSTLTTSVRLLCYDQ